MPLRLSIDVGGTFTDLVLVDDFTGQRWVDKIPSTPDSGHAVVKGIKRITDTAGVDAGRIEVLSHGFTIATNAWLTRTGARVVLLVTTGFRDILALGSQRRPETYNLAGRKPQPLVPRSQVVEVEERMGAFGTPVAPLTDKAIALAVEQVKACNPEAIAISLLFSWANADHEEQLAQALQKILPEIPLYCSHIVNSQIEEYPRANTTAAAAYVGPPVRTYTRSLEKELERAGIKAPLHYMRSDGGVATAQAARSNPANMLLSGPAGGVVASAAYGAALGIGNLITFDMGGTSADFSVTRDGYTSIVRDSALDGLPLRVPMLEIKAISAGGGSIGWIDRGGALRVGPHSAGANPGPAAYGAGGTKPTLTDAALVLGLLIPESFAGGDMPLNTNLAEEAVKSNIAQPLGIDTTLAAKGMFAVGTANMAQAIRQLSTERGDDVAEFTLLSFGGAGGLFAPYLLRELGLKEVLVPRHPGVFAALGLHFADLRHHLQTTFTQTAGDLDTDQLRQQLERQAAMLASALEHDAIPPESREFQFSADMRYIGQHHELEVRLPPLDAIDASAAGHIVSQFHDQHERRYGYCHRESPAEFTGLRAVGIGVQSKPDIKGEMKTYASPPQSTAMTHTVLSDNDTQVFHRDSLQAGHLIDGPAIITQGDSTLVVLPDQEAEVDDIGFIHLTQTPVTTHAPD